MITINLPPELEKIVTEQAERQGTTPELLVTDMVRQRFLPQSLPEPPPGEGTMADFLADFIGCLDSSEFVPGGAQMSTDTGKKFAAGLLKKRQEGRL